MQHRYVALIRHGEYHQRQNVPSALQPHPLTDRGMVQAKDCADLIRALMEEHQLSLNSAAYCSEQLRAWQTARVTTSALAEGYFTLHQTSDLSERALGSAANMTLAEIEAALALDPRFETPPAGWKSSSAYCLPLQGAESLMMAGTRVAGFLSRLVQAPDTEGRLTLTFGHGAAFRHAAHILGVMRRDEIAANSMYHARPLLLCYNPDGTWSHCGGAWKQRGSTETMLD